MKKIYACFSAALLCLSGLYAQEADSLWYKKTLSDFGEVYFGISNEMGDLHKTESYFWGFDIGIYLPAHRFENTKFKIGLGGAWLDNGVNIDMQLSEKTISYPANFKFGGLRMGMLFFTDKLFVPSFDVLIAGGDLRYQVPVPVYNNFKDEIGKQTQPIYMMMPKLNMEIKITQKLKFGWGFSYRYVRGIDAPWSSNKDVSDFGYHGTFIGTF